MMRTQHDLGHPSPGSFCATPDEVRDFIAYAVAEYDVDPARVYLTGLSCGGFGTWEYLETYGDGQVAAAVPIAGEGRPAWETAGCQLASVPIWAFHGALDDVVNPDGSIVPVTGLSEPVRGGGRGGRPDGLPRPRPRLLEHHLRARLPCRHLHLAARPHLVLKRLPPTHPWISTAVGQFVPCLHVGVQRAVLPSGHVAASSLAASVGYGLATLTPTAKGDSPHHPLRVTRPALQALENRRTTGHHTRRWRRAMRLPHPVDPRGDVMGRSWFAGLDRSDVGRALVALAGDQCRSRAGRRDPARPRLRRLVAGRARGPGHGRGGVGDPAGPGRHRHPARHGRGPGPRPARTGDRGLRRARRWYRGCRSTRSSPPSGRRGSSRSSSPWRPG